MGWKIPWLETPRKAVYIIKRLKAEGYRCTLSFIGKGELEEDIKAMVNKYSLNDIVSFLGAMPAEEVRHHMERASIFLFTSDREEGWGAVLNEAMNSACAIVASHTIGSVPYLVEHGKSGLIYINDDIDDLYRKVKLLLDNHELVEKLGVNAYNTIQETWNGKVAAERIIELSLKLMNKEESLFVDGPCSKAKTIKNKDIIKKLTNR